VGCSKYVGRIGGLAVALGVGLAVATPTGVAWAAPDSSTPSEPSADNAVDAASKGQPSDGAGQQPPAGQDEKAEPESPSSSTVEAAKGVKVSSSGGAHKSRENTTKKTLKPRRAERAEKREKGEKADKKEANADKATAQTAPDTDTDTAAQRTAATGATDTTDAAVVNVVPMALTAPEPAKPKVASPVTFVLNSVVQPLLSSFLGALGGLPSDSPLSWIFLAASRREVGQPEVARTAVVTTAALVADQPPTVITTFGTPVATTGAVTGQVVGTDPEGKAVTYKLTTPPTTGTLVFDSATAKFTYTPTTAQRITAGVTPSPDTIAMTVTVSDGTNNAPTVVNIPVSAAPISKLAEIGAVNDAHAVAVTDTRAYVTNKTAGTVVVIDTTTNSVIGSIAVGPTPDGLAIKPDGTRLYVTSLANNSVTVVDTTTNTVKATISTAKPSAIAMSASGNVVYVANQDAGTITKISTSTNAATGTVKLPTGLKPTGLVVSPDKLKIYVISGTAAGGGSIDVFAYTGASTVPITTTSGAPTALAISPDNKRLYVTSADKKVTVVDTATKTVVATYTVAGVPAAVNVSKDGSTLLVTDTVGRVAAVNAATGATIRTFSTRTSTTAMTVAPGTTMSPDGTRLYVTDYDADKVYVVSLVPANTAPNAGTPTVNAPNATTGAITGSIGVIDADQDPLKYTVTTAPTKGTLVVNANGTFTYTPTAAARHAASTANASTALTTDSFTVSVTDGRGGVATPTITVNILPANKAPTTTKSVGTPNSTTGVVTGYVKGTDADKDALGYTASTPAKGTVTVTSTGSFTYTPTAAARHAAAKVGASAADKTDTFTITVNDGHGGVVPVAVSVTISPANAKPTGTAVTGGWTNLNSGVVTGTLTSTDTDNDTLSYKSTAPTKGTLVLNANGTFTYTPTAAARQAASAAGATTATKTDSVTVTVSDGYGGTATYALKFTIAPNGHVNVGPSNGRATESDPNMAIGEVTGVLTADDPERDVLNYSLATGPTKGLVTVNSDGTFSYVPDVESRWGAKTTTGVDTDTFTVKVTDGYGGTSTFHVSVTVAPPSTSTAAIDQRATTVSMNTQELVFDSQADTDKALDLLKADGVDTIRILIPWASVEPSDDSWSWTAIDRMVNSARARNMKVLAVLNSTPQWAATPGTPALSGHPADPAEYAEFVSTVATRYKGKISAYEVWNEPNGKIFWDPAPNAAQYTALLKAAYPAIKAADPDAVVVAGSVGAVIDYPGQTIDSVKFVKQMYEAGAAGYFDALSYHPYLYNLKFSQGGPWPNSPLTQVNQIHDLMVEYDDGNKKIWATEYGQPAGVVSEANQADFIGDFLRAWRNLDFAGPAFIHTIRDYTSSDPSTATFGVYRANWTAKPAVGVIETVINENKTYLAGGGGINL
jgi:YVTN family beta-propeller protein/VCBS repeat-containing protein